MTAEAADRCNTLQHTLGFTFSAKGERKHEEEEAREGDMEEEAGESV